VPASETPQSINTIINVTDKDKEYERIWDVIFNRHADFAVEKE